MVHWRELPQHLKSAIYANYKPGQNIKTASNAYLNALDAVLDFWIDEAVARNDGHVLPSPRSGRHFPGGR